MNDDEIFLGSVAAAILFSTLLGWAIGSARGRAGFGFTLGLLLGPIGCLVVLLLPAVERGRRCPFCQGVIPAAAVTCMHCTRDLGQRIPSVRDNPFV
jgi:hypothetical protein